MIYCRKVCLEPAILDYCYNYYLLNGYVHCTLNSKPISMMKMSSSFYNSFDRSCWCVCELGGLFYIHSCDSGK